MKQLNEINWWHRIKLPDGAYTPGQCKHGPDGGNWPTTRFGVPEDLRGKTVLDIGTYDGFFAFEAEKRGAIHTLGVDVGQTHTGEMRLPHGFEYAKHALSSEVKYRFANVQDPDFEDMFIRRFDVVFLFGVLYHCESPLLALKNAAKVTRSGDGICLLETAISDLTFPLPVLEYRPGHEGDPTNYFYPNDAWIHLAAKQVGFKSSEKIATVPNRATYRLTK